MLIKKVVIPLLVDEVDNITLIVTSCEHLCDNFLLVSQPSNGEPFERCIDLASKYRAILYYSFLIDQLQCVGAIILLCVDLTIVWQFQWN